jgi:hypothetical protein
MSEKSELNKRIELEALITEREGMIACSYPNPTFDPKETWKEFAEMAEEMRALKEPEAPPYTPDGVVRLVEAAGQLKYFSVRREERGLHYYEVSLKTMDELVAALAPWRKP